MKIIVTAGGTSEPIDQVRSISNHATGRLGSMIANEFLSHMRADDRLYYLCGEHAVLPDSGSENLVILPISSTNDLLQKAEELLKEHTIDVFVHSMAVSDYTVKQIASLTDVSNFLFRQKDLIAQAGTPENLQDLIRQAIKESMLKNDRKLSSAIQNPLLLLEKTPKIIGAVKKISPHTKLVGFKLLCNVSKEELIDTALQLLNRNGCEYVLANDLKNISGNRHNGYLVAHDGSAVFLQGKQQIAQAIVENILNTIEVKI